MLGQPLRRLVPVLREAVRVGPEADREAGRIRGARATPSRPRSVASPGRRARLRGSASAGCWPSCRRRRAARKACCRKSAFIASTTSRVCHAVASSTARARWPRLMYPVSPAITPARVAPPVRREQAREGRHEIAAAVVLDRQRERLDLGRAADQPDVVAEPLHERAGDRDRALERVRRLGRAELVCRAWSASRCARSPGGRRCSARRSSRCRTCTSRRRG